MDGRIYVHTRRSEAAVDQGVGELSGRRPIPGSRSSRTPILAAVRRDHGLQPRDAFSLDSMGSSSSSMLLHAFAGRRHGLDSRDLFLRQKRKFTVGLKPMARPIPQYCVVLLQVESYDGRPLAPTEWFTRLGRHGVVVPPGPPPVPVLLGAPPFFPMPRRAEWASSSTPSRRRPYAVLSTFFAVHVSWSHPHRRHLLLDVRVLVDLHSWTPPRLPSTPARRA